MLPWWVYRWPVNRPVRKVQWPLTVKVSSFRRTSFHIVVTVKPPRTLGILAGTMVLCLGEGDIVADGSLVSVLTTKTDDSVDSRFGLIWFVHVSILSRFGWMSRGLFTYDIVNIVNLVTEVGFKFHHGQFKSRTTTENVSHCRFKPRSAPIPFHIPFDMGSDVETAGDLSDEHIAKYRSEVMRFDTVRFGRLTPPSSVSHGKSEFCQPCYGLFRCHVSILSRFLNLSRDYLTIIKREGWSAWIQIPIMVPETTMKTV